MCIQKIADILIDLGESMYNSKHQMWKYLVLNIFHSHWRPLLCFYPYLFPYPSQTMWLKMLMLKLKLFSNKLYWIKQWKLPAQKAVKVMIFDCIINLRFVSSFVFVFRKRLQDVFKTFWSRRIYSPWSYVFGRRLQDVFKTSWSRQIYLSWSYVFKTS